MQSNLKALFAGKREAVELPPKRGPGRPKKVREDEAPDEVLEAVRSQALHQHESIEAEMLQLAPRRSPGKARQAITMLAEAAGMASISEMRMPGAPKRRNEGPQVRLQLCEWIEETLVGLGGDAEVEKLVFAAVGEQWDMSKDEVIKIFEQREKWKHQCAERGVTAKGLSKSEVQLPRYLRKSKHNKGTVVRAAGGGRKDALRWLYPLVREYLKELRLHGKSVDAVDLEEHLMSLMQMYLTGAAKAEVKLGMSPESAARVEVVRNELERLRDPPREEGCPSASAAAAHEGLRGSPEEASEVDCTDPA